MIRDVTLYNKQELLQLRALHDRLLVSPANVLQEITDLLMRRGSPLFSYALLLLAANTCVHLFRYDEADSFLQRADDLSVPGEVEQSFYYLIRTRIALGRKAYDDAFVILQHQLAREGLSLDEQTDFFLELCMAYRGAGAIKESLQTALELRELYRVNAVHNDRQIAKLAQNEHNIGNLYGELGRWEESLLHIEAALQLYRQIGHISGQARAHNGIAVYFFMSSAYEVALESYTASERLYTSVDNERKALSVRGNIAMCYHELQQYDKAVGLMQEVADRYYALGDRHNYTRATINLAVILLDVDVEAAEAAVLKPDILPHLDVIMKGARALILASAARDRGEYTASVELARQTIEMCELTGYDQYRQRALELIAHALRQLGDSVGAYEYQGRAYDYARDQHRRQLEAQRRALTLKLERERIEHERVLLQAEVEQKQKELTATTLKLVERSKLMGVVTQRLRDLRARVSDRNKPLVSETLMLIESQSGNVWEAFEQSLDGLTNRFFHVLAERHPDLSSTEQRIAGLLRAGMSTKEIATAMHISTRTVETHRYRLRKKMHLAGAAATELIAYLQQLDSNGDNAALLRETRAAEPAL